MRRRVLLFIFLAAPIISTYAQGISYRDCADLKDSVSTAYSAFEEEQENGFLAEIGIKKYDEKRKYVSLNTFFQQGLALINIDCTTSDERQDIIDKMNKDITELLAGGIYFYNEKDYDKAIECFSIYASFCRLEIATPENRQSEYILQAEYYAIVTSIVNADNHQRTISLLESLIQSSPEKSDFYELKDLYYFLADEYQKVGNESRLIAVMEAAMSRLPKEKSYFTAIVVNYYMTVGNNNKAIEYLEKLIKKTRKRSCEYAEYLNMKANLYVHQKDYKTAEGLYKKGLKKHPDNEPLTEGLGVMCAMHAQDLKEANNDELNDEIIRYYKEGAKLLEKYRSLLAARNADSVDQRRALGYLQNIYYNLKMFEEFEAIDKLLDSLN